MAGTRIATYVCECASNDIGTPVEYDACWETKHGRCISFEGVIKRFLLFIETAQRINATFVRND